MLELTSENLSLALGASKIDDTDAKHTIIKGKNFIELSDYIGNITWVGTRSGSNEPIIIQVLNALNTNGLTLQAQDKKESTVQMIFTGHYAGSDLDNPPFAIYYPKAGEQNT